MVATPTSARELWLLDDDRVCLRSLARALRPLAPDFEVFTFAGVDEADAALLRRTPAGVLVDEQLGEDRGHLWVSARRSLLGDAHVVLITGRDALEASRLAYLGADAFLVKPVGAVALRHFVERASAARVAPAAVALAACCERWNLSPTQSRIVERIARGVPRDAIAAELDLASSTVNHHIKAILRKSGQHTLPAVVASILQQVGAARSRRWR